VRHERDRRSKFLLNFGRMTVREYAVGRDAPVAFGKVRPLGRRLAGAGHSRLRIDDDAGLEQRAGDERLECKDGCRRVAPRTRDEPRARELQAAPLGQAVGNGDRGRTRMGIPALAER